jgi:hypothetical protein
MAGAFATNPDGTAKDPAAYTAALRADPERVKALQARARRHSSAKSGTRSAAAPPRRAWASRRIAPHASAWLATRRTPALACVRPATE